MTADALTWNEVAVRFAAARNWWVSTVGSAGPHAVPVWGVVVDDALTFYGAPTTVRTKNLLADPRVVVHLEDGEDPLIVHGVARSQGLAREQPLLDAYRRKYRDVNDAGYLLDTPYADTALIFEVAPTKALAWRVAALEEWMIRRWRP